MAIVTSSKNWPVDNQEKRMKKGPLVRVEIAPGRVVKMYRADAIEQGYVEAPETKEQPRRHDKQRLPEQNKEPEPEPEPDDFTEIDGVGPATARAIVANGITTFDALRAANLDFLSGSPLAAVEEWREAGG